jgi:hypothetical protein
MRKSPEKFEGNREHFAAVSSSHTLMTIKITPACAQKRPKPRSKGLERGFGLAKLSGGGTRT